MKSLLIFLSLLLVCGASMAQSVAGQPFIAVHGHAEVQVVPDRFSVSVTISDKSLDAAKTQQKIETLTALVFGKIKELGLDSSDISVGNLEIEPDFDYDQKLKKQVFIGNEYTRSIDVVFHDLADLRKFISGLPSGKEIQVSTGEFTIESINEARRKLVVDAISDARKTAGVYAAAIGKRIASVQTISDRPLSLSVGSYINAIDVSAVESTSILTAEQISRIPVARNVTNVALLSPGTTRAEIVLEKGAVTLESNVYVIFLLGD